MPPKIIENWSKNRSGADLGPLIVGFLAFWSDAKKSRFFDTSPVGQKSGKSDKQAAWRASRCERGTTFWDLGPQGGAFSRAFCHRQRANKLVRTGERQEEGSNTPVARGPANKLFSLACLVELSFLSC